MSEAKSLRAFILQTLSSAGKRGVEKGDLVQASMNSGLVKDVRTTQTAGFEVGRCLLGLVHTGEAIKVVFRPNAKDEKTVWYEAGWARHKKNSLPKGTLFGDEVIGAPANTAYTLNIVRKPRTFGPFPRGYQLFYTDRRSNAQHPVPVHTRNLTIAEVDEMVEVPMGSVCMWVEELIVKSEQGEEIVKMQCFVTIG